MNAQTLEDIKARAQRKADERLAAIQARWNQPTTEIAVGQLWHAMNNNPGIPADVRRRMEQLYGESK